MSDDQKNDKEKRPPPRFIIEMARDASKEIKDTLPLPEILIEDYKNSPHTKTFNVNRSISLLQAAFSYVPFSDAFKEILKEVGPIGEDLCLSLASIIGVDKVMIEPYRVAVLKGKAFSWKNIELAVLENIYLIVFLDRSQKKIKRLGTSEKIINLSTCLNTIVGNNEEEGDDDGKGDDGDDDDDDEDPDFHQHAPT